MKKWIKRLALALLLVTCLYTAPLAWLYWGWKQEQPARQMLGRVGGRIYTIEPAGPAFLKYLMPARLGWIRERTTEIRLMGGSGTDDDLRTLRRLSRLKLLNLYKTQVTDAGLAHLEGLTGLKMLVLNKMQVTDAGLVHLKGLTGLKRLHLEGTQVTDAGLVHLRGLMGLQELYLNDTRVTDAGLVHLQGLTGLQMLSLYGAQKVTDAGLVHLKGLTQLQYLNLHSTSVSDAGLLHLRGLTGLQRLWLEATRVTDAGEAELQKALPGCQIIRPGFPKAGAGRNGGQDEWHG